MSDKKSNATGNFEGILRGLGDLVQKLGDLAEKGEEMKRSGGFVPGIKPGAPTADFIDSIMSRITLPGSIFLAIIAILPALAMLIGVTNKFAQFYGGTSLLILVGVVLDTLQQVESHLLMRQYDGLMKSGRLKGRATSSPVSMTS